MDLGLRDKVVLITGSSRGIGRAIAMAFAEEGARLVITGRTGAGVEKTVADCNAIGGRTIAQGFVGDLLRDEVLRQCVDRVVNLWGRIDVLVANIGSGKGQRGWEVSDQEWHRLLDTNLMAGVRAIRAVGPQLIRSGSGSVLLISSIAGLEAVGAPPPYEVGKAAVIAFSKNIARELAAQGVRVNVLAPGNICFPGSTWDEKLQADQAATMATIETQVPLKRFGRPEEVAAAAVFLASARASFITGACLVVDGGQTRTFA